MYRMQLVVLHDHHLEKLIPGYKHKHEKYQAEMREQLKLQVRYKHRSVLAMLPRQPFKSDCFEKTVGSCPECQKYLREDEEKQ